MADDTHTTYDDILAHMKEMESKYDALKKEFSELRDFNRALLAGGSRTGGHDNNDVAKEKLDKYLKGE